MILRPLPLSHADLERYRIRARQQRRPGLTGGHQMRRKGQSLEFRDFREYIPGDDVRHIDWRASMRQGPSGKKLIREFVAEENMTLVISIDFSESMWLPEPFSKLQIACWLAEAISVVALSGDDAVVLHPLFGGGPCAQLRGKSAASGVRQKLQNLLGDGPPEPQNNLVALSRNLPPTSVWLILSDFYFPDDALAASLAKTIYSAQQGFRWVLSLDLDSWPRERQLMGHGARRIEGPRTFGADRPDAEIDDDALDRVAADISAHKDHFRSRCGRTAHDLLHWPWPGSSEIDPRDFFRNHFERDQRLQRLFMRSAL